MANRHSLTSEGSIILPWLRLRRVPVRSVVLSDHAVRLYFDYGVEQAFPISLLSCWVKNHSVTTKPGHFTRISDNPLMEWHGFATINEPGKSGYSLVVSKAGYVAFYQWCLPTFWEQSTQWLDGETNPQSSHPLMGSRRSGLWSIEDCVAFPTHCTCCDRKWWVLSFSWPRLQLIGFGSQVSGLARQSFSRKKFPCACYGLHQTSGKLLEIISSILSS